MRQIVELLAGEGVVNPDTEQPWSRAIIGRDCKALEEQWEREATEAITKRKASMLAELHELQAVAWKKHDYKTLLKALAMECDILGLDAPTKVDIEHTLRVMAEQEGLDPDEVITEAQRIISGAAR